MPYNIASIVLLDNGTKMPIDKIGFSLLSIVDNCDLALTNMLHAPKASTNLIYVNKLCHNNNVSVEFFIDWFCVKDLISKKIKLEGANKRVFMLLKDLLSLIIKIRLFFWLTINHEVFYFPRNIVSQVRPPSSPLVKILFKSMVLKLILVKVVSAIALMIEGSFDSFTF